MKLRRLSYCKNQDKLVQVIHSLDLFMEYSF